MPEPTFRCVLCGTLRRASAINDNLVCKRCREKQAKLNSKGGHAAASEVQQRKRLTARLRTYDLSEDEYEQMLTDQQGACAICGSHPPGLKPLNIDHDHETGAVRALLCAPCNLGLGLFRDDPSVLVAAIGYLDKYGRRLPEQ